jgi:hypothetical protein
LEQCWSELGICQSKPIISKPFVKMIEIPLMLGFAATTVAAVAGIVSAVSAVAGGVMSAVSAKQQGDAAEEAAKYNAAVADNEALAAQQAAAFEAKQIRRKNMLRLGMQRASVGKSGVSLDAGSSFDDVMFDSAIQGELEAQSALYTGRFKSQSALASGQMALFEGKQAQKAAGIGMASGAIGALGGVAQGAYMANYPRLNSSGAASPSKPQPVPLAQNLVD